MEHSRVSASATGTAIQTPIIPNAFGKRIKETTVKTKVLQIANIAETFPLESAVNIAETNTLIPIKR